MLVCPLCRIVLAKGEAVCPRDGQTPLNREPMPCPASVAARFQVIEPYAEGDAGTLYLADDKQTGRRGLLKLLRGASAWTVSERGRLKRELLKQATLTHPGLVVPMATGEADNVIWLFREWIDGVSLAVKIARTGALPAPEALSIAAQIASALDELHRAGLLQRDLSPGHVIVQSQPNGHPKVALLDAGIAMRVANASVFEITGKAGYVSPEHANGKLVSFRSDLYSLGCLLHEMLTGNAPFRGNIEQVLEAQRSQPAPNLAVSLPSGVSALIAQLLVKEPRDRPFSAQQVRRTLEPFLPEDASARREPTASFAVEHMTKAALPANKGSGTLRPPTSPQKRTLVGFAVPKPGSSPESTQELSPLDLARAEQLLAGGSRSDATQELSSMELGRAEQVLAAGPPPPFRRDADPTTQLSGADLAAARPQRPKTAPPPPPQAALAPTPPPAARQSVPPPVPVATQHAPAPGFGAPGLPPTSAALTTSPGVGPAETAGPASDLDYDDLAETNAMDRDEAHALLSAPGPVAAPPSGHVTSAAAFAVTAPSFPAANIPMAQSGASGVVVTGAPAPFPAATQAIGTQAMAHPTPAPVARAGVSTDDDLRAAGLKPRSRVPFLVLGGLVAFCLLATATGLGATFLFFQLAEPDAPAIATAGPGVAPPVVGPVGPVGVPPVAVAPPVMAPPVVAPVVAPPVVAPPPEPVAVAVVAPEPVAVAPEPEPVAVAPVARPEPRESGTTTTASPRIATTTSGSRAGATTTSGSSGTRTGTTATTTTAPPRIAAGIRPGAGGATTGAATAPVAGGAPTFDQLRDQARGHFQAHRYADAARTYEQMTRLRARDGASWAGLGAARLANNDAQGAIQAYRQALSIDARNVRYHVAMGRALAASGDRARARQAFEHALQLDPGNRDAQTQLSRL